MLNRESRWLVFRTFLFIAVISLFASASWAASNGKVLHNFTGGVDGSDPASQISFDQAGNGYGTTVTGGNSGCGTVFQLVPSGNNWQLNTLYSFSCFADGKNPYGGVTLDSKGNLYGTTVAGGSGGACAGDGCGVVYTLTKSGSTFTQSVLYNFTGGNDGAGPGGGVVFDSVGNLYGSTPDGGANSEGVVYELSPTRGGGLWTLSVIHAFTGGTDGAIGSLGLLLYTGGNFYGVSEIGGDLGLGTVFQLAPASGGKWTFNTIHEFQGQPNAASPYGGLITDGRNLYGTTYFGGTAGQGTVYRLTLVNGKVQESVLYSFTGGNDGSNPTSTPVFSAAGSLYATTTTGGDSGCSCGTVVELSRAGNGVKETTLHDFRDTEGASPTYGLAPDAKGNLYGVTPVGGSQQQGVVYSFTP